MKLFIPIQISLVALTANILAKKRIHVITLQFNTKLGGLCFLAFISHPYFFFEMTREEKNNYLRIALGSQKISVSKEMADRIIETYEKVLKLKGNFSIKDVLEIELLMDRKYKGKELDPNGG